MSFNHQSSSLHDSSTNNSRSNNASSTTTTANSATTANNNTSHQHKFDVGELRETVLIRAAARFGRLYLRDPTTLVNRSLLRKLITTIRTTASLGHRSSVVLWGPPQGGKRSTLEALSQIFCVSVENKAAASLSSCGGSGGGGGSGVGITVHRHPMNSSSTVGGGSLATTTTPGNSSGGSSTANSKSKKAAAGALDDLPGAHALNKHYLQTNKGIPILGVVLDGTTLRSDHDAAQQCLNALYDFWWLAATVRARETKKWASAGGTNEITTIASTSIYHASSERKAKKSSPASAFKGKGDQRRGAMVKKQLPHSTSTKAKTKQSVSSRTQKVNQKQSQPSSGGSSEKKIKKLAGPGRPRKYAASSSSSNDDDDSSDEGESDESDDDDSDSSSSSSEQMMMMKSNKKSNNNKNKTAATTNDKKKQLKSSSSQKSQSQQQQQQHSHRSSGGGSNGNGNVLSASNFLIQGAPFWAVHADELLNWLFTEALPETLHKQAPPTSAAAAATMSSSSTSATAGSHGTHSVTTTTTSSSSIAHNLTAFRTAIQQTFRVFTHGGNTVLTALQTTLLELSKGGISPCFLIHDIRLLGQNCDKILYMISGLLHEQEVLSATNATNNNNSNNNNNSRQQLYSGENADTFSANAASSTSMMNAGLNLLAGAFSNHHSSALTATLCGGGLSIIMTSPNPDLRLEKRLSSRMNCDYFFCPQIVPNFLECLASCFLHIQENIDTNEALHFSSAWAVEDSVGGRLPSSLQQQQQQQQQQNPIASMIVPGATQPQNNINNNNISSSSHNKSDVASSHATTRYESLLQIQQQLSRRRVRAHDDPRIAFMDQVRSIEEDIAEMLLRDEIRSIYPSDLPSSIVAMNNSNNNNHHHQQDHHIPCRFVHPLRALYLDFSDKCEQLSRPAHIIRRLLEAWFEIAIESCYLVHPLTGKQVDIFNDPKSFITGEILERACFGVVSSSSSSSNSSSLLYGGGNTNSSSSSSSSALATSFFSTAMNTIYFPSASGNGPLAPLETFALSGTSPSMPRECVSLLACLISAINQQRRGAPNAQVRTLQEHFVLFQELRGNNSTLAAGGGNASTSSTSSSGGGGGGGGGSSSIDTIDSWIKACALLRRWGIIRVWNGSGGGGSSSSAPSSSSNATGGGSMMSHHSAHGNIAASITSTSKIDLEIENIEALQNLVFKSLNIVYDTQLGQSVKALLR